MQASVLRELCRRRLAVRTRWEALLRAEPVASPLGMPDALVHLIDCTLEEVFTLIATPVEPPDDEITLPAPHCPCGRNPLLAFFAAARQATQEGLVLAQAASAPLDPAARDAALEELNAVLDRISRREIEAFCGICQFREAVTHQPLALAMAE